MNDEQYMFVFDSDEERIGHEEGDTYTEPYVSLIRGTDQVHYNSEGVEVTYLIPQNVWNGPGLYPFWAGTTTTDYPFNRILVDGKDFYDIEDLNPKTGVFFNTPGVHTIRFFLTDKTFFGNTSNRPFFDDIPLTILGIKFPNTLQEIGMGLFARSTCLIENLVIPEGVTVIGDGAFLGCIKLKSISFPSTLIHIGSGSFADVGIISDSLIDVVLPNSVITLGYGCFSGSNIGSITFGSSLENIPQEGFKNCTHLTRVVIPPSVEYIGREAFSGDTSLSTVELFEGRLKRIDVKAFYECPLEYLNIPEGVTTIGRDFLTSDCLETLVIPNSVTTVVGDSPLFNENRDIIVDKLKVGSGFPLDRCRLGLSEAYYVEYSGDVIHDNFVSENFGNTWKIELTGSPTTIGQSAFCGFLGTYIDLPQSITTLGRGAFSYCPELRKLVIPPLVTEIPDNLCTESFEICEVVLSNNLVSIGDSAFCDCCFTEITLPSSLTSIGGAAFPSSLKIINIPANSNIQHVGPEALTEIRWYSTLVGEVYVGKVLVKPVIDLQGRYVVKEGTTEVCDKAFQNSSSLVRVTLPSTLLEISEYAFAGCRNLSTIVSNSTEAPITVYGAFGTNSTGYTGAAGSVTPGTNNLYVPVDATGYDQDEWLVLLNESKGGFQIING